MQYIKKVYQIVKRGGAKEFVRRLKAKTQFRPVKRQHTYQRFLRATRPTEMELAQQRQTNFDYHPCFGVVIPLYNTKLEYVQDLLGSFREQTYPYFKLFMVDASPVKNGKTSLTDFMLSESKKESRIIYQILEKNDGIANNTNHAIKLALRDATITHLAFCDHDDFIEPDTFFEYAKIINQDRNIKIIYSDEDIVRFKNDPKATYVMKPDFDPYLLESCNYINHFFVCEKRLLESIKTKTGLYEQPEYDGAQDYDLYLRLVEKAMQLDQKLQPQATQKIKNAIYTSSTIYHLPKVLYHWRAAEHSTASDPHNKIYAYDAACQALQAHFERQGIQATVKQTAAIGTYCTKYHLESKPLVSVIIPNLANSTDLYRAVSSIQRGIYRNVEFIITNDYSGVEDAHGDILLFADGDLEMLNPSSISEMVALLERDRVGAVGAKLVFPNGRLQHAGIIAGLDTNAGHIFYRMYPDYTYGNRANCVTSYSAVSNSCLMIKKSLYKKIGGFDEELPESFRGMDLCLKLRTLGKSIVYTPHAKFRFHQKCLVISMREETEKFRERWPAIYQYEDPYYNRNFSRQHSDCTLKNIMV